MSELDYKCDIASYSSSMFDKELQIKSFYKVKRTEHTNHLQNILPYLFKTYVKDEDIMIYILDIYPQMAHQFIAGQISRCKSDIINSLSEQILNHESCWILYKNSDF